MECIHHAQLPVLLSHKCLTPLKQDAGSLLHQKPENNEIHSQLQLQPNAT